MLKDVWDRLFKILDKVVHWTTPYPVDSYALDKIVVQKHEQWLAGYPVFVQWTQFYPVDSYQDS